jgi:hypothetical protein
MFKHQGEWDVRRKKEEKEGTQLAMQSMKATRLENIIGKLEWREKSHALGGKNGYLETQTVLFASSYVT